MSLSALRSAGRALTLWAGGLLLAGGMPSSGAVELRDVLARMDQSASKFRGLSAKVRKVSHTAVINETSVDAGSLVAKRKGKEFGFLVEFTEPAWRTVCFQGSAIEIYYPKINTVQVYDLGKQRDLVEEFLLLGFGTSGKNLVKNHNVKLLGEPQLRGHPTWHLELAPKSKQMSQHVKKIELWLDPSTAQPVQQKFYQAAGDYTQIEYSDLTLEPNLPDSAVALKVPPGAKREYPQK